MGVEKMLINNKIAIFGPPSVGKTTLIFEALKHHIPAFSSHGFGWARKDFFKNILYLNINLIVDPGDVSIYACQTYSKTVEIPIKTVLLLPPKQVYMKRYLKRRFNLMFQDIGIPGSQNQHGHEMYAEFKNEIPYAKYDLVVTNNWLPEEIVRYIVSKVGK